MNADQHMRQVCRYPNGGGFALLILAVVAALALAGCQTTPPEVQTRVLSVPSSAPYRFIHYSDKTDGPTAKAIRRHNRAHAAVIEAEKKAAAAQAVK
jgi:uncharacterized lipoprotein YmbA